MEYLEGLNLYKYMIKFEPTVYTVVQIVKQLADALEYADGRNIIHRDLKLNNVIMKDNATPILIDFGLAKAREADSGLTISGEILGSPSYMSPEQALGLHVDERTDIYSMGIMFYELLTSKNPFYDKRGYQQTIWNVIHSDITPLREISDWIPRDVETIVLKSMEKEKEKRYQTMRAFRMDLERFQVGEPIIARSPGLWERIIRRFKKRRGLYIFTLIILAMLGSFGFYYRYQMSLEKADWKTVSLKPEFYLNLDGEWHGEKGDRGEPLKFITMDSPWVGSEKKIQVSTEDYTWISWKKVINNDIRLDFNLMLSRMQSREFGCFIHGSNPDNGYTFRFLDDGIYLTKQSRSNIIDVAEPKKLMKDQKVKIRVEKNDYIIRLYIDNNLKMVFRDYTPISSRENNSIGFYIDNGGIVISDVVVCRLGLPFKTRPIETAERFFEREYYKDAIDEYRNIIALYPNDPMAVRARFKIGLSHMRLNAFKEAISEFEGILRSRDRGMLPRAMSQIAQCYLKMGNKQAAEKMVLRIRDKFPNSSAIVTILSDYNNQILGNIRAGNRNTIQQAEEALDFLVNNFKRYVRFYIQSYLQYGQMYIARRHYKKAKEVFNKIEKAFSADIKEVVMAKVRLAEIESYMGGHDQARAMFNNILSSYHYFEEVCAESWMGLGLQYRAVGKTYDALKCYNYIINEYSFMRELSAKALLNSGFSYMEKDVPDPLAQKFFQKVMSKYRDCDREVWIARLMLNETTYNEVKRRFDLPMLDYYIAERFRADRKYGRAFQFYGRFKFKVRGNKLLIRLANKQMAYIREFINTEKEEEP
jgi:serine/threonine protein kinase